MSTEPTSSNPRRTLRDVQQEIALGFQHLDLSNDIDPGHVVAVGGYADVYRGTLVVKKTNQIVKVATKKIRCMLEKEEEFAEVRRRYPVDRTIELTSSMIIFVVILKRALHMGKSAAREYPAIDRYSCHRRNASSCVGMDGERDDERILEEARRC